MRQKIPQENDDDSIKNTSILSSGVSGFIYFFTP